MTTFKVRHFNKTVTAAGTRERLTDLNINVPSIMFQAEVDNGGQVYIGDNQVSSTSTGVELDAGDSFVLSAVELGWASGEVSLRDIWIDVGTSSDGVWCLYLERKTK